MVLSQLDAMFWPLPHDAVAGKAGFFSIAMGLAAGMSGVVATGLGFCCFGTTGDGAGEAAAAAAEGGGEAGRGGGGATLGIGAHGEPLRGLCESVEVDGRKGALSADAAAATVVVVADAEGVADAAVPAEGATRLFG